MENIIIDTCVFFGMVKYDNFATEHGIDNVPELLKHHQEKLEQEKESIENYFKKFPQFYEKNKNLSFEDKLENFKAFYQNQVEHIKSKIKSNTLLAYKNVDKNNNPVNIPEQRKLELKTDIKHKKEQLAFYKKNPHDFKKYRELRDSIQNGKLYLRAANGEVNLHLLNIAFREILNHTKPKENNPSWLYFSTEEIYNLTKRCHIISTHSKKTVLNLHDLAKQYRKKITSDNRKQMSRSKNSLGEFGDSLIMAGASLSGMILVTQNEKDFIYDKSRRTKQNSKKTDKNTPISQKNDYIRQNIACINEENDCSSNALCYTVEDFLAGKYTLPTKFSSKYELVSYSKPASKFLSNIKIVEKT